MEGERGREEEGERERRKRREEGKTRGEKIDEKPTLYKALPVVDS